MAQRKDSPNRPSDGGDKASRDASRGGGNEKTASAGGGKGAASGNRDGQARNTTVRREKASPSARGRGETSQADRA